MKCRLCKKTFAKPILVKRLPLAAQHFLNKNQLYLDKKNLNILQCKNCGLVQLKLNQ